MGKNKFQRGFTIIELIVVIAIIAVLSSIVTINVQQYIAKTKITRTVVDAQNMTKALTMYSAQYGDYPSTTGTGSSCSSYLDQPTCEGINSNCWWDDSGAGVCSYNSSASDFYGSNAGDSNGAISGGLSQFYNSDLNANYFIPGAYYEVSLVDSDGDGKIGCGMLTLYGGDKTVYGTKNIICHDCPDCCDGSCDTVGDYNTPFTFNP